MLTFVYITLKSMAIDQYRWEENYYYKWNTDRDLKLVYDFRLLDAKTSSSVIFVYKSEYIHLKNKVCKIDYQMSFVNHFILV